MNKKIAIILFLSILVCIAPKSKADWVPLDKMDEHEAMVAEYQGSQCPNGEKMIECCTIDYDKLPDCEIYAQDKGYYVLDSMKYTYKYCKKHTYILYHPKELGFILLIGIISLIGLFVIRKKYTNN
ncbi:hypothetical protein KAS31_04680 [Candidatus Parcubacteria bacterium]|nr:hypothetical protein [Candidatus Parcubacteria bacterium]